MNRYPLKTSLSKPVLSRTMTNVSMTRSISEISSIHDATKGSKSPIDLELQSDRSGMDPYTDEELDEVVIPDNQMEGEENDKNKSGVRWYHRLFRLTPLRSNSGLSLQRIEELKMKSMFSDNELNKLYIRFSQYAQLINIDGREELTIRKEELLQFPQLAYNPLKERIVQVLQLNEIITFDELVDALQKFSVNYPKAGKIKLAFEIYDFDGDQLISRRDMAQFLATILNSAVCEAQELSDHDLDVILDQTFMEMGTSKDGYITLEQFKRIVEYQNDIVQKFSLDF